MTKLINDKNKLYRHFSKAPVLFAYHIGDLDDFYFKDCIWRADVDENDEIKDIALIYNGLMTPTVMLFSIADDYELFIIEIIQYLPLRFYCHFLKDYTETLDRFYHREPLGTHYKMKLTSLKDINNTQQNGEITRLNRNHKEKLINLFNVAYPDNYFNEKMLDTGKYLGYIINDKLVGVSGVHTCSDEYNISVLGNITVHPSYRGRGIGTVLTSELTNELNSEGKTIALNVHSENTAAIKSYQNIGFEIIREYEESLFIKK